MKDGFVKIGAAAPDIRVADLARNCDECVKETKRAAEAGVKLLVFPELALSGATAADLFLQNALLVGVERQLERFIAETAELDILTVIGLPVMLGGNLYNCAAVVYGGELLGIYAKSVLSREDRRYFTPSPDGVAEIVFAGQSCAFGTELLFCHGSMPSVTVGVCIGSEIFEPISPCRYQAVSGATLIANPAFAYETVGRSDLVRTKLIAESHSTVCAIVTAYSGKGESGTDGICSGECVVAQYGEITAVSEPFADCHAAYSDCDFDRLLSERLGAPGFEYGESDYVFIPFEMGLSETTLSDKISTSPFFSDDKGELAKECELILDIQSRALADRVKRSYSRAMVLGVSGGLDSTLALLVAVKSADLLGLPRECVKAVTMPCFGTTERTKGNAERLCEALGVSLRCIDIKAAVNRHFEDIGHDSDNYNAVYENAQARERTQVLMDIANAEDGLVVGTGDLSELALGWATYNGDHMSMYGVNAGLPKTLMRHMVSYCADTLERDGGVCAAEILRDVLATPVSPELLPPKEGEIVQCTEGIVGPYELHDFFLYYTVRWGFSPAKILRVASHAFDGVYEPDFIKGWLRVFVKRFFSQQFKRSCLPDGPVVGPVSLSPRAGFKMPSDAVAALWLSEIEDK